MKSRLAMRKLGVKPKSKTKKKSYKRYLLISLLLMGFVLIAGFVLIPGKWDGSSKLSVAVQKGDGDVEILVLSPQKSFITTLVIPAATQVTAANNLGVWKLGSISKLGRDKGIDDFLKNTLVASFNFPVDAQANESFLSLTSGNLFKELPAAFTAGSGFSFFDNLRFVVFSLQVGTVGRQEVDLSTTDDLERAFLPDGTLGWHIASLVPVDMKAYFVMDDVNNRGLKVLINNASGANQAGFLTGSVVGTMGEDVVSLVNVDSSDFNCTVTGESTWVIRKIANIFMCDSVIKKPANNFDIQIDLGEKFLQRF